MIDKKSACLLNNNKITAYLNETKWSHSNKFPQIHLNETIGS